MAAGTLGVARVPYGYDKVNGRLVINDEQAAVVRRIFTLYIGCVGARRIATMLNAEGLSAPESAVWNNITIYKMLSQEMYLGDIRWQKTASIFMGGSRINTGQADSFYVSGSHEPIIDRQTFESARSIRLKSTRPAEKTNNSPFRQKIVCGVCGRSYYYVGASHPYWQCSGRIDIVRPCTNAILHNETLLMLWRIISIKLTRHADDVLLPLSRQLECIFKGANNADIDRINEIRTQKMALRSMCAESLISYGEVLTAETELNAEYRRLSDKMKKSSKRNEELMQVTDLLIKAVTRGTEDSTEILKSVRIVHDTAIFEFLGGIHIRANIPRHKKCTAAKQEPLAVMRTLALCGGCGSRLSRRKSEGVYLWKCPNRRCQWWRIKHNDEELLRRTAGVYADICAKPRLIRIPCQNTEYRPTAEVIRMETKLEKMVVSSCDTDMLAKVAVELAEEKFRCIEYSEISDKTVQIENVLNSGADIADFLTKAVKHIYVTPDRIRVKFINGKTVKSERKTENE